MVFLFRGAALLVTVAALAQSRGPADRPQIPQPVFRETEYSAGVVEKGSKLSHTFVFKNAGRVPLEIKSVTPT
ncbi:MAG: DUF1573 domain-containing protein [Acidobacteriota bacterium]